LEESGSAAGADAVRDPSMSRLRELAQLRTNGMITEEEFTIAKRHIFKELRP
jgi:hypothetical protein